MRDFDVGYDPFGLDRGTRRRVVALRRKFDRAVPTERNDRLNRTFAERVLAEDNRPAMVLQRPCDDFRSRSRTTVDQYDNRQAVGDVAWRRMEALRIFLDAATCRYDLTSFKKRIRDHYRLIQ